MQTAGRAVAFSALTVAGACAALLMFPLAQLRTMGLAGVVTALFAASGALLVVPALLPRVGAASVVHRDIQAGAWYRFSRWVMGHATLVALGAAALILAVASPALGVQWTFTDSKSLPAGTEPREVADALAGRFVPHQEFPLTVALPPGGTPASDRALTRRIAALPGAGLVTPVRRAADGTGSLQVVSRAEPLSDTTTQLVGYLRSLEVPVQVGGHTAEWLDLKASIRERAGPALAVVGVATLVAVFLLTGSAVLPVKTLLMNALTIFAVLGAMTAIFGEIETTVAVVAIALTVGLATDYSVLLLARIKEEHDGGRPNEEAVAIGLERSGRVVTNAALLLIVALMAAAFGRIDLLRQIVVGVSIGVLIDATVVRACLVPSLMRIMGDINWWAPRSLSRRPPVAVPASEPSTPPAAERPSSL
jgi:RND superfamily putative drug exporter